MQNHLKKTLFLVILFFMFLGFKNPIYTQEYPTAIAYGDILTGEITHPSPQVRFMFNGSAGDVIAVEMLSTDRRMENTLSEPVLQLLDPSLQIIADTTLAYAVDDTILFAELPEDGRYIIVATRDPNVPEPATGGFTLELQLLQELSPNSQMEDEILSNDVGKYYVVLSDAPFFIEYKRLSGDYVPEISINRIIPESASLGAAARSSGTEMTEAKLGKFQAEVTYIIQLSPSRFDFQFGTLSAIYRLSVSP